MWRVAFQVMPVCAWCMALLVAVLPLKMRLRSALAFAGLLALALGKFAFFSLAGGDSFVPDLPESVIWCYGGLYSWAMLFTAFALVAVLADGVFRVCGQSVPLRVKRVRTAILALVAAVLSAWGIYEGVRVPDVHRMELAWKDLPAAFDGYRIVHMSDLHCSSAARRGHFERIVEVANSLDADLIAITGDFVDGYVADREADLAPLAELRAKDGIVGCTGNHEAYWDWKGWGKTLKRWGISFPEESGAIVLRRGNGAIAIGAVRDPAFLGKRADYKDAIKIRRAFDGVPKNAFRIFLCHRPWADAAGSAPADVRLQLSGHTHGGIMPPFRPLVAAMNEGRTNGLYEFAKDRFLNLSTGTGQWAGFPLRLFNPTEITEITLRRR